MIPIGDVNPRRHFPIMTLSLIAVNALVFLYQILLPEQELQTFIRQAGLIPAELTAGVPSAVPDLLTSMFLHGGWMHIISNMLYLWIFGDNIEDLLGPALYLLFYLAAGVIAALAQVAVAPNSRIPTIGASGAIAGVLGAYTVIFPTRRIRTLLLFGYWIRLTYMPAFVLLGFWFVLQLFSGVASLGVPTGGGVAWFAHIGGFVAGLLVGMLLRGKARRRPWPVDPYSRRPYW